MNYWRFALLAIRCAAVATLVIIAQQSNWLQLILLSMIAGIVGADFIVQSELRRDVQLERDKCVAMHAAAMQVIEFVAKDVQDKQLEADHYRRLYLKKVSER